MFFRMSWWRRRKISSGVWVGGLNVGVHEKRPLLPRPVEGWPYGSAVRKDSHNLQSFAEGMLVFVEKKWPQIRTYTDPRSWRVAQLHI